MQMITRKLVRYAVNAAHPYIDENGEASKEDVYSGECYSASLSKNGARKFVSDEIGGRLPKRTVVTWEPVATETFQMPLDEFIENATRIEIEEN